MGTPSDLKEQTMPGIAWDVFARPLLLALDALLSCSCVIRAGLSGDHLRAITPEDISPDRIEAELNRAGIYGVRLERVEPTLEDVFLTLSVE
jgi:hypothetical protein